MVLYFWIQIWYNKHILKGIKWISNWKFYIHFAKQPEVKGELQSRNADIYMKYKEGISTKVLSEIYYLSLKSIQKITFEMKKGNE